MKFANKILVSSRGLYSSFDREKPPYKKLPFLADFIKNWAPFIKNSILAIFTDPKAKRSENAPNNQMQSHIKDLCCNFYSATAVEMTPEAQTNIEFYEIAHFLSKTTTFYLKLPPFIENCRSPPYKKLQYHPF